MTQVRRPPMPEWLRARLETQGLMDPVTGATRRARAMYCRECSAHIFRGLNAEFGSQSVDVDPMPVSALGEVLALLDGIRTFELKWLGDRYEIDIRDQFRVRACPAGSQVGCDVVVEHDCDRGGSYPIGSTQIVFRAVARVLDDADPGF